MPPRSCAAGSTTGDPETGAARELLARVPLGHAERVVDLGCGPGNSTALLRDRFPGAKIVGVDNSPEMLRRARADGPEIEWMHGDVATWRPSAPVDVLSGVSPPGSSLICLLMGRTSQLSPTRLHQLYPSRDQYVADYTEATDALIKAGFALEADRQQILAGAQPNRIAG